MKSVGLFMLLMRMTQPGGFNLSTFHLTIVEKVSSPPFLMESLSVPKIKELIRFSSAFARAIKKLKKLITK